MILSDAERIELAARNGHTEAVKVLIEFGADVFAIESNQKMTARQLAHPEHPAVVAVLDAAS